MVFKIVMLATCIRIGSMARPKSLEIWRVDSGHITASLIHRVTTYRGYRGACVGLPNPTFLQRNFDHSNGMKLYKVQDFSGSAVDDKHSKG